MKKLLIFGFLLLSAQPARALSIMKDPKASSKGMNTSAPKCVPIKPGAQIRLELPEVELGSFVHSVGRALCKNLVVDPKCQNLNVSVSLARRVSGAQLWSVFLSSLAAHKLTVVQKGPLTVVIPAMSATRSAVPLLGPKDPVPDEERMFSKVILVKKDLNKMTNYLNVFKSPQGQLHPYPGQGMIVMTDYSSSIKRMLKLARWAERGAKR